MSMKIIAYIEYSFHINLAIIMKIMKDINMVASYVYFSSIINYYLIHSNDSLYTIDNV